MFVSHVSLKYLLETLSKSLFYAYPSSRLRALHCCHVYARPINRRVNMSTILRVVKLRKKKKKIRKKVFPLRARISTIAIVIFVIPLAFFAFSRDKSRVYQSFSNIMLLLVQSSRLEISIPEESSDGGYVTCGE